MRKCIYAHFECNFSALIFSIVFNYRLDRFDEYFKSVVFLVLIVERFVMLFLKLKEINLNWNQQPTINLPCRSPRDRSHSSLRLRSLTLQLELKRNLFYFLSPKCGISTEQKLQKKFVEVRC